MYYPRYVHDCDNCKLVGRIGKNDVYTCEDDSYSSIVARFGNDGPDYMSGSEVRLFDVGITLSLERKPKLPLFDGENPANEITTMFRRSEKP